MNLRLSFVAALALAGSVSPALATDTHVLLNYNWNGMVHPGEAGQPDAAAGYRAIADRAMLIDGSGTAFGTNPIVGATGISYTINGGPNTLDIVHLGNTGTGTTRAWDATANGDTRGIQPTWLVNTSDHINPQVTTVSPGLVLDSQSAVGVLYQVSNGGGNFDMVLGFSDSTSVTVTCKANDWFGATNPPAAGTGVASQSRLGATTYASTAGTDSATATTAVLSVTEAVVTTASLNAIGGFNATGKTLTSITFQNANQPTRGYAIFAATVVTGLGPPLNDNCANAQAIPAGATATSNLRATGATTSGCGNGDTTDVWYSYQATATGLVEARTCGALFDTTVAIYGSCGGPSIACNDNGCGLASKVRWNATSGQTYLIRVAGNNGATGQFNLVIDTAPAVHTDQPIALTYNWNGMCHVGEDNQPDSTGPSLYRSISDRGFYADGTLGALNAGQLVGQDFMPYFIQGSAAQLDMVHLGISGAGTARPWDTGVPGGLPNEGVQPDWLTNTDQSTPQRTDLSALNIGMGPNTQVGVVYHISNNGGTFTATLEFSDSTTAVVTLAAPDWFGSQAANVPPPSSGVALQHELGTFTSVDTQDTARTGAVACNAVEAVFSTSSLISGGLGDPTGKRLMGITFGNPSPTTNGFAIFAATLRDAVPNTSPVPPSGVGSAVPATAEQTRSVLLRVSVNPGQNPISTGLAVTADLSSLGGSSTQQFYDDHTHGDVTAGDGIFSFATTISASQNLGQATIPFTVSDAQSRSTSGNFSFNVVSYAWNESLDGGGDAGELPATAQAISGDGPLPGIRGTGGGDDADMYAINICDPSSFFASTANSETQLDTQLFLFRADGTGVSSDDDNPSGGAQSVLTNQFVTSAGLYYLAVTTYNKDPLDSGGNLIWSDTPFDVERAPDGPGLGNPIAQWGAGAGGAGTYLITLTGVCRGTPPPPCGSADFNCDGDTGTDADIEAFFRCLAGDCPGPGCPNNADFNGDGDTGTDADIEAFFRVLAGGNC